MEKGTVEGKDTHIYYTKVPLKLGKHPTLYLVSRLNLASSIIVYSICSEVFYFFKVKNSINRIPRRLQKQHKASERNTSY